MVPVGVRRARRAAADAERQGRPQGAARPRTPAPRRGATATSPPRGPVEEALAAIWAEVLGARAGRRRTTTSSSSAATRCWPRSSSRAIRDRVRRRAAAARPLRGADGRRARARWSSRRWPTRRPAGPADRAGRAATAAAARSRSRRSGSGSSTSSSPAAPLYNIPPARPARGRARRRARSSARSTRSCAATRCCARPSPTVDGSPCQVIRRRSSLPLPIERPVRTARGRARAPRRARLAARRRTALRPGRGPAAPRRAARGSASASTCSS